MEIFINVYKSGLNQKFYNKHYNNNTLSLVQA